MAGIHWFFGVVFSGLLELHFGSEEIMFADKETMIADILVVMFLVATCTSIYGGFVRDAVIIGVGAVVLLLFFCLLWGFKKFRKH